MLIDEFSYASPNDPLPRKLGIRCVELLTGQPYLKRLYCASTGMVARLKKFLPRGL